MDFPNDDNGDVLRRMADHGFDFSIPHEIEFFAIFATEENAEEIAKVYVRDREAGRPIRKIETGPYDSGHELFLAVEMLATHKNISDFESELLARIADRGGRLDGWGVMQS